jgi:hypothetical protein
MLKQVDCIVTTLFLRVSCLNDNFHLTWIPAILAQVYAIFLGPFWQVQLKA